MTGTLPRIVELDRADFLARYWRYAAGEHVTLLGPTKSGKTTLGYQLLDFACGPRLPGVVLVMKPRDATAVKWNKLLEYRRVKTWPPATVPWQHRPRGWTLWPRHTFEPDTDDALMYREFRKAMLDSYKKGNRIVFGDEVYGLSNELKLNRELVALWTRGRSMGCGLWAASQKPTHIPLHAYNQAEHLFLHNDPDKRSRERYSEIGGVNPDLVRAVTAELPRHSWLYIRRDGPAMCIVGK